MLTSTHALPCFQDLALLEKVSTTRWGQKPSESGEGCSSTFGEGHHAAGQECGQRRGAATKEAGRHPDGDSAGTHSSSGQDAGEDDAGGDAWVQNQQGEGESAAVEQGVGESAVVGVAGSGAGGEGCDLAEHEGESAADGGTRAGGQHLENGGNGMAGGATAVDGVGASLGQQGSTGVKEEGEGEGFGAEGSGEQQGHQQHEQPLQQQQKQQHQKQQQGSRRMPLRCALQGCCVWEEESTGVQLLVCSCKHAGKEKMLCNAYLSQFGGSRRSECRMFRACLSLCRKSAQTC